MVYLWFILPRNRTIPKHYLSPRESRSIQVYMYSISFAKRAGKNPGPEFTT